MIKLLPQVLLKGKLRRLLFFLFIVGLIYVVVPVPDSVEEFFPPTDSIRSDLDGDTWQNPNIAAYFSDFKRESITEYYREQFAAMHFFGRILPPVSLNHPPEYAYTYIRDQQESTFLEEYLYPLRESIFVNGYEPMIENQMFKKKSNFVGDHIYYQGVYYDSKTTLRFYPSNPIFRVLIYVGIWLSGIAICKLFIREWKGG